MLRTCLISVVLMLVSLSGLGAEQAENPGQTVRLAAVGDVLLCRGVAEKIELNGPEYLFEYTSEILSDCDLAFCNLECALSTGGEPLNKFFLFRADPSMAMVLSEAGFDIVSLGNNHTLDYGVEALRDTADALESAGMLPVGIYEDWSGDSGLRLVEVKGVRIGFLALNDIPERGIEPEEGYPFVSCINSDSIAGVVRSAKAQCDTLVVSVHWGIDYVPVPTERQQRLARIFIDNGADLVLGHHPHVLQYVEEYNGKVIVYSMGGFVWDSPQHDADVSAILMFDIGAGSAELVDTIPVSIVDCRPEV